MDERKRERVIARLALVLVLLLVVALLWRPSGERAGSWAGPVLDRIRAEVTRITAREAPPATRAERTPAPAPSARPAPPDGPPPVLDVPAAAPPPVAAPLEAAAVDGPPPPAPAKEATPSEPAPPPPAPEERERAAALARMVPPASGDSAAAMAVDALALDRMMERGIGLFNASDRDGDRREGARIVYVTAALGYGPARAVIARAYPRSQAVRAMTPPADAVRFALDAFAVGGTYSRNPEHVVTSLMVYLLDQGQDDALAHAVIDAMRDDPRFQVVAPLELMFDALDRARGACPAIGRLVQALAAFAASECNPSLKAQALSYARQAGPTGRHAALRRKAAADFDALVAENR